MRKKIILFDKLYLRFEVIMVLTESNTNNLIDKMMSLQHYIL